MHHMRCRCQIFRLVSKNSSNTGYFTTTTTSLVLVEWWCWHHHHNITTTLYHLHHHHHPKSVVSRFTLFWRKISCVAIYAFLVSNFLAENGADVKKMTNMRYVGESVSHFPSILVLANSHLPTYLLIVTLWRWCYSRHQEHHVMSCHRRVCSKERTL